VTQDPFTDRLDAATFADDPVVGIYRNDPAEPHSLWIPERLFARVVLVGRAYELHTLPLLGGSDPVRLNRPRIESLVDELDFVRARISDDLVEHWTKVIADYATSALTLAEPVLTVEGE
jgi:hypothetical protein